MLNTEPKDIHDNGVKKLEVLCKGILVDQDMDKTYSYVDKLSIKCICDLLKNHNIILPEYQIEIYETKGPTEENCVEITLQKTNSGLSYAQVDLSYAGYHTQTRILIAINGITYNEKSALHNAIILHITLNAYQINAIYDRNKQIFHNQNIFLVPIIS